MNTVYSKTDRLFAASRTIRRGPSSRATRALSVRPGSRRRRIRSRFRLAKRLGCSSRANHAEKRTERARFARKPRRRGGACGGGGVVEDRADRRERTRV